MDHSSPAPASTPAKAQRVLVLQGGGALGSYQAGAYQALCHFDFEPEWIAGISIGAVNAAIIAGNPREKRVGRLKEFWEMVSAPVPWNPITKSDRARSLFNETSAALIATFGVPGFFTPRLPPAPLWPPGSPQSQSYYDTAPLKKTLESLVDFDRINDLKTRLSVGAVGVTSGNFRYFDNFQFRQLGKKIGPEHVLASGALPPGFPSVEIDGEHYWDGGLVSNTPLQYVIEYYPRRSHLVFQVDLFPARGALPGNLNEVTERDKDIRYSSRTRAGTDTLRRLHDLRHSINMLWERLPDDLRIGPEVALLDEFRCVTTMDIVEVIYRPEHALGQSKDYEFDRPTMETRWAQGLSDAQETIMAAPWLEPMPLELGARTFDVRA